MKPLAIVEWWKAATEFLGEVRTELKNVSWPNKKEVQGTTAVVIVTVFIFGLYLWAVDVTAGNGIRWVFSMFSGGSSGS